MKILYSLLLLLMAACSADVAEDSSNDPSSSEQDMAYNQLSEPGGGTRCSPAMVFEIDGKTYFQPMLCPIPTKPDPDPIEMQTEEGLVDPIVSPAINSESLH